MLPLDDVLTWEGVRDLSTCFAMRDLGWRIRWTHPDAKRAVLLAKSGGVWSEAGQRSGPKTGEIVGTRDAWWGPWRKKLIQHSQPFTLVSNFHDSLITQTAVDEMFSEGSAVRAWFGVQVNTTDPRVTRMPVGCERETVAVMKRAIRWEWQDRDVLLYMNFKRRNKEREALWERFPWATKAPWSVDGTPSYVNALGRAKFVLSPPGRGWDCYRTYEAIAMGAVPIVRRQAPISDLCETLPVLMVNDWSEVTPERLVNYEPTGDITPLRFSYWKEQIHGLHE